MAEDDIEKKQVDAEENKSEHRKGEDRRKVAMLSGKDRRFHDRRKTDSEDC